MLTTLLVMLYTVVFIKDSRILKAERNLRERAKALSVVGQELEPLSSAQNDGTIPPALPSTLTRKHEHKLSSFWIAFKSFFDTKNIKLGFLATFKKREENKRTILLLTVAIFLLVNFSLLGQYAVLYLYFRKQLSWTHVEYTQYQTTSGLASTLSQGLLVPFLSTKLKWQVVILYKLLQVNCVNF